MKELKKDLREVNNYYIDNIKNIKTLAVNYNKRKKEEYYKLLINLEKYRKEGIVFIVEDLSRTVNFSAIKEAKEDLRSNVLEEFFDNGIIQAYKIVHKKMHGNFTIIACEEIYSLDFYKNDMLFTYFKSEEENEINDSFFPFYDFENLKNSETLVVYRILEDIEKIENTKEKINNF